MSKTHQLKATLEKAHKVWAEYENKTHADKELNS